MDQAGRRAVSRHALGNAYFLEVGVAISRYPKDRFTQQVIAQRLGIQASLVKPVLDKLKKAKLLETYPNEGLEVPLSKVDSCIWGWYEDFEAELERI